MIESVKKTINKYKLIRKGDKIVVGVSGGPDSVALLYILSTLNKYGLFRLHVAHLDHMLRKNSYKDAAFVRKLAIRMKLPLTSGRVNVKKYIKNQSIEEAARNARFDFFFRTAKKIKANKIALAHNLDDQAETVLMRILRGTGLYGLSGISVKRKISGFEIIRPLIKTKRSQIEAYLRALKVKPRQDKSNLDDIYFRNKIRHKLIPLLEKQFSPNIKELLANLAENSGSDYRFLESLAAKTKLGATMRLSLNKLKKLDISMQRLIIRKAIKHLQGDTRRITFKHMTEIEDLVSNRPQNSIVDLPNGISVLKKKSLVFYRR